MPDASWILHITTHEAWAEARRSGEYRTESLRTEGFIHCSTPAQVEATAERYYLGHRDLILLVIDPARVQAPLKFEEARGLLFPHIYGPLNLDAVQRTVDFPPGPDGRFRLQLD